ncbi:MAG: hypothetical protein GX991_03045 [Clostridiaceae bacterium]|nr:hypothetical protein [Clostridiaceae bacterium]
MLERPDFTRYKTAAETIQRRISIQPEAAIIPGSSLGNIADLTEHRTEIDYSDAVGMSTVTETLTAGHAGMEVLGFSLIKNMAAGVLDQPLSDEEVGVVARASAYKLGALIEGVLLRM